MLEHVNQLPNKKFAFECLNVLKSNNKLSESVITTLCSAEQCNRLFDFASGFSVLIAVKNNVTSDELNKICCFSGHRRYYKDLFNINGKNYVVTNHWYGPNLTMPDNRTLFVNWVSSIL